jgi:hypothetical protein
MILAIERLQNLDCPPVQLLRSSLPPAYLIERGQIQAGFGRLRVLFSESGSEMAMASR